jgi:hypothetical protein
MNHSNIKKFSILAVVATLTIAMTLSPMGINHNTNMAFAGGDEHDDDGGNSASQIIAQVQSSVQNSQVVSGDDTKNSGNNFNFQNQENKGDNVLAQE